MTSLKSLSFLHFRYKKIYILYPLISYKKSGTGEKFENSTLLIDFRHMPWHSREDGVGMELELHYQVFKGPNGNQLKRRRSAAILTIDKNNVNVIGPVSIAQRLMFATAAAAAAVPKNNTTRYDFKFLVQAKCLSQKFHQ